MRRLLGRLAAVAFLTSALAALWRSGDGVLRPPPLSVSGAKSWLVRNDALAVSFALLRIGCLVVGSYLLLVLIVGAIARVASGTQRSYVVVDRLSFGAARGLLTTLGLSAVAIGAGPAAQAQAPTSSAATIHAIESAKAPAPSRATIRALPASTSTTTTSTTTAPAEQAPTPVPPSVSMPATTSFDAEQYVVTPGDSLWSVSASRVSDVTGQAHPSEETIASYWRTVLAANALENPDLLFVGQVIELPVIAP